MTWTPADALSRGCGLAAVGTILSLAFLGTAAAQHETFSEAVDVRVVDVDVFVTDRKGKPIVGLTREDFVLYEDGVEVEISNFHSASQTAGGEGRPPAPSGVPVDDATGPAPAGAVGAPLWAVVYLDDLNLDPADRSRILDDLQLFARTHVRADVRFLLATNDLGFKTRTSFTRDPTVLVAAIEAAGDGSAIGMQEKVEYKTLVATLQRLLEVYKDQPGCADPCPCAWPQMVAAWRSYSSAGSARVGISLDRLGELVSALGGVEGRKAVFYVSSGLMQNPGIGMLKYLGDLCPDLEHNTVQYMWEFDETSRLDELASRANANRVTLYALDAGGLRSEAASSVEHFDMRFRPSSLTQRLRVSNLQGSLQYLAEKTGGQAILNANHPFDDLNEAAQDFDNFYSLGFSPAREPDGETHQLRVELRDKRKGELRYRRFYRDKPLDERLGDRLMATLRFGVDDNPLGVVAAVGASVDVGGEEYEVPVRIRVPADRIVIPGEGAAGRVRVFLAAEDGRGWRTALKEKTVEVAAPGPEGPAVHELVVNMRLRHGPHRISIGVRDEIGVELSLVRLLIEVGPAPV